MGVNNDAILESIFQYGLSMRICQIFVQINHQAAPENHMLKLFLAKIYPWA